MKFLAVCGSGLGSSFMVQMNIEQALKDLGITSVEVDHSDVTGATSDSADVFFVAKDIYENVELEGKVVVLNSIIDNEELKEKVKQVVEELGITE